MTTATAAKEIAARDYRNVELKLLIESRHNPRKTFSEETLGDLAASIKEHGIITPLIVRSVGNDGKFEVLAGARRMRAAALAELKEVPCRVIEAENDKALDVIVVENLQRENVHPLEEAEGFHEILELSRGDVTALCLKIGKTRTWVEKRLSLLNLIDKAKKVYLKGGMPESHAIILSRHQPADQKDMLEYIVEQNPSVHDLRSFAQNELMAELARAPWDKADKTLCPKAGSCVDCKKRTGLSAELFDDIKNGDRCTDIPCFKLKMQAHIDRVQKELEGKGKKVYGIWSGYKDSPPKGTLGSAKWLKIGDKKHPFCDRQAKGIFLDGSEAGTSIDICPEFTDCKIHGSVGLHGKTPAEREKTRKENLKNRIEKETRARALRAIYEKQGILEIDGLRLFCLHAFERLWHAGKIALVKVIGWPLKQGQYSQYDFASVEKKIKAFESPREAARFMAALTCAGELDPRMGDTKVMDFFAKENGLSIDVLRKAVAEEFEKKSKKTPATAKKRTSKKKAPAKPSPKPADDNDQGEGDE